MWDVTRQYRTFKKRNLNRWSLVGSQWGHCPQKRCCETLSSSSSGLFSNLWPYVFVLSPSSSPSAPSSSPSSSFHLLFLNPFPFHSYPPALSPVIRSMGYVYKGLAKPATSPSSSPVSATIHQSPCLTLQSHQNKASLWVLQSPWYGSQQP